MNNSREQAREQALQLLEDGKEVTVCFKGVKYQACRVVGTKLDFPLVWIKELDIDIEFSWQAILNSLQGRVLIAD